jgi:hypothetical protein
MAGGSSGAAGAGATAGAATNSSVGPLATGTSAARRGIFSYHTAPLMTTPWIATEIATLNLNGFVFTGLLPLLGRRLDRPIARPA